ncbi:unnamed protein product [Peronospora farinosa]|uniref:Myosin-like protein n=1 Tax=Peronospora farinosa TaxID=134698 RepID=A0AAV0UXI1_9STRA|nr:unnamed protein product [Peronospora farinosa]CAI5740310.1 unnamed protein product [Peronospora farinosa]
MDEKETAKAKLLIATLQKYGYDLEDPTHTSTATSINSSDSSTEWSPDDDIEPVAARCSSVTSSAGILALRDRKNQQSALHIAAKKAHFDVLRALAKLPKISEHVNAGDRHSNTALHFAASSTRSKAPDMVELLLNLGANPSATNIRGQTPLAIHIMTAKPETSVTITKLFIDKFRQLQDPSSSSTVSSSSPMGLRALAPCAALNELVNGTTYLHMAVDRQLGGIGGALVQGGASINVPDHNGVMVSDTIPKKLLVKLITFMAEGSQVAPSDIVRGSCKICRNPKSLLEPLKDCILCGRAVCKNCSKKASEIRKTTSDGSHVTLKDKDEGRFCAVCCTVKILKSKQHNQRENFNKKLMGCDIK